MGINTPNPKKARKRLLRDIAALLIVIGSAVSLLTGTEVMHDRSSCSVLPY